MMGDSFNMRLTALDRDEEIGLVSTSGLGGEKADMFFLLVRKIKDVLRASESNGVKGRRGGGDEDEDGYYNGEEDIGDALGEEEADMDE